MANQKRSETIESKKCITPVFRVSFPSVFKASSFEDGEAKFGLTMIFSKDFDLAKAALLPKGKPNNSIRKILYNAMVEKWGADKDKWPKKRWNPIRDGDTDNDRGDESLENANYIRASSKTRPGLVGPRIDPATGKLEELTSEEDFYPGCYAQAEVLAYAFDRAGKKGLGLTLLNIQKVKEGEPLSGRRNAADVFESLESEEEESSEADDDYDFD